MEKRFTLVAAVMLLVTGVAFALDDIYVSGITTIPGVALPGDVVYVTVSVKNVESYEIDNVVATLEEIGGNDLEITPVNDRAEHIEPYGVANLSFTVKIPEHPREKYLLELVIKSSGQTVTRTIPIYTTAPTNVLIQASANEIRAGTCGNVEILVKNRSNSPVENAVIAASAFPPTYVRGDVELGNIGPGDEKTAYIPVCADGDAVSGIYPVTVTITYASGAGKGVSVRQIPVTVRNRPKIIVAGIKTNPDDVKEGQEFDLHLILQNVSAEAAYDVSVSVDKNVCNPQISSDRIPGTTPIYRGMFEEISVHCKRKLPSGAQNIPVKIYYKDRYGREYEEDKKVTLLVDPYPHVEIARYFAENTDTSRTGKVIVTLRNTGSKTAKHVSLFVDPEWPFSTDQKRDYVDEILPGEEKNAIIYLSIYPNAKTKQYGLKLRLEYEGPDDKYVEDSETISVPVKRTNFFEYSANWIVQNWLFSIFAVVVLGGLTYLVVMARRP